MNIYSDEEFNEILSKDYVIIMDTNVLLGLYSCTPDTIQNIVDKFEENIDKFWLPNQVFEEYNRRFNKIREVELNRYNKIKTEVCKAISNTIGSIDKNFNTYSKYNIKEVEDINEEIKSKLKDIIDSTKLSLDKLQKEHSIKSKCIAEKNDIIYNFINKLKVKSGTNGFTMMELLNIYEEGEKRYKYKMPPGFTDVKKKSEDSNGGERKYGDLVVWKECLNYIKNNNKNLIFIENEIKSDWWDYTEKETKIPKIMSEEFEAVTSKNEKFVMVSLDEFIRHISKRFSIDINAVGEVTKNMKFMRELEEFLDNKKKYLVEDYISTNEIEYFVKKINDYLIGEGVYMGNIDEVDETEIKNITIVKGDYTFDSSEYEGEIEGKVICDCNSKASIYINKGVIYNADIEAKLEIDFTLLFSIRKMDSIKEDIKFSDMHICKIETKSINENYNEYSLEDDEDINDYYDICPDCGCEYGIENDGGNGFCSECSINH